MGRKGNKRDQGQEDQHGSTMVSQDKNDNFIGGGGGTRGGTAGGSSSRRGADISFTRQVPKFLQSHAHLLGAHHQVQSEEIDATLDEHTHGGESEKDDDAEDAQEALKRAVELDPSLALQYPELLPIVHSMKAASLKETGNKAFSEGKWEDAARIFDQCIELDPTNEIYWSNKAAALIFLKHYQKAADASRQVVKLNPNWVKGYARLGMALLALNDVEAKDVLEKAVSLEPNDASLHASLSKAIQLEEALKSGGVHVFKRKPGDTMMHQRKGQKNKNIAVAEELGSKKKKQLLSFADDEDNNE